MVVTKIPCFAISQAARSPFGTPSIAHRRQRAGVARIEVRRPADLRQSLQPVRPAGAQIPQPGLLPLHPEHLVEGQRLARWRCGSPPGGSRSPRTSGCRPSGPPKPPSEAKFRRSAPLRPSASPCRRAPSATCGARSRTTRAPRSRLSNLYCTKACAPSTSTGTPRRRPISTISRIGKICPFRNDTCDTRISRVREVIARSIGSSRSAIRRGTWGTRDLDLLDPRPAAPAGRSSSASADSRDRSSRSRPPAPGRSPGSPSPATRSRSA